MKIIFIGCVRSNYCFLEVLLRIPKVEVIGVVTRKASRFNADFVSLENVAEAFQIPCLSADQVKNEELFEWVKNKSADICLPIAEDIP